jgi:hypothetical protein
MKKEGGSMACCATAVEKCLVVTSADETWIQKLVEILKSKYEAVAVKTGDEIDGLVGMKVRMDRNNRSVILMLPKNVERIITAFGVDERACDG